MEETPPPRRQGTPETDLENIKNSTGIEFHPLDPSVRFLWLLGRLIFWCLVFVGVLVLAVLKIVSQDFWQYYFLVGVGVLGFLALIHMLWPFLSYRHWGYAIRGTDFMIQSGVLWKRMSAIPFARIQHVDSNAGPVERAFGIANLVIHTAGAHMGSLSIPGLPADQAESLRDYLSEVGHTHANI